MTDFPMYKKYSIYDINGDTVSKETFEQIENLQKELSLSKKENELMSKCLDWYAVEARKKCVFEHDGQRFEGINFALDEWGKYARETKTKIKNLREGKDEN